MIKPEYKRAIYQFADIPEPRGDVSDAKMLSVIAEALAVISLQIHFFRSMIADKETKEAAELGEISSRLAIISGAIYNITGDAV